MKRLIIAFLIIGGIGAGVGAYYMRRGGGELIVNTLPVTLGDVIDAVGSTGTLQPVTTVTVGSQVSGLISELDADFNSLVHKGPDRRQDRPDPVPGAARVVEGEPRQREGATRQGSGSPWPSRRLNCGGTRTSRRAVWSRRDAPRYGQSDRRPMGVPGGARSGADRSGSGAAQSEPGQPRPHHHHVADRRHRHAAQRRRRPDGRRQHVGADDFPHRGRFDEDAGQRRDRRVRRGPDTPGAST